jgi:hypothetical protein
MPNKVTLKCLSICPCGFPVLKEDIKLGTEYEIDPAQAERCTFICGGCGRQQSVECVWVEAREHGTMAGFLPKLIFEAEK